MDRKQHAKYIPWCPPPIGLVDQYMWENKNTNNRICQNGVSHPIYERNGDIHFSLPLEMYPPVNEVHPQIYAMKRWLMNDRN